MMLRFRLNGNLLRGFLLSALLAAGSAFAQDYSSMGISSVVSAADGMLKRNNYTGAIPALEEVIRRTEELTSAQGRETLQVSRFQLARAFYQVGNTTAGMAVLRKYLEDEPRKEERLAFRMMAQGYFETQEWAEIETIATRLLGLPKLSKDDRQSANLLLGQALFRQEKWAESIDPLTIAAENAKDAKTRQLTQIMVVRALVESERWKQLFGWIPKLYRTDAKYDITLNLTLMNAGKALFEAGEPDDYINALLLYRMVLPREKLIDFSEKKVNALSTILEKKAKLGIPESEIDERQTEIDRLNESMKLLNSLPPYEDEVTFRIGQIYAEVKRYWEGYVLFDSLYLRDRNSDIGEASILQSVLILYDLEEADRAEKRVLSYLDEKPDGQFARVLLSMLLRDNLKRQNADKIISFLKYMERIPPSSDVGERHTEAELHYMMAFGFFQKKEFKEAGNQFTVIIEQYPDSPSRGESTYFRGMTFMMQGDYQSAIDDFRLYQEENDGSEYYPSAMFREAVCQYGMENVSEAEAVFTKFIDTYEDEVLTSEAYSMRGDIEAAKDGNDNPATPDVDEYDPHTLDRALADYRKGIDKAIVPQQASYAAFQAAKVYKLEFKWKEIIKLMNYYLDLFGEKADVAQAVFWIGQAQIELKQLDEAIEAYLDAIERFGNDVTQEGIDKIVLELITTANRYLSEEDRQGLDGKLKSKLASVDKNSAALKLRLRVALAHLESEEAAVVLGAELLAEQKDLSATSPISLSLMCDAAVAADDAVQMGRLYDYFLENFEESDLIWHAYRAKTFQLLSKKDYPATLESIDSAQGLFGADVFMGWSQLTKADIQYEMGLFKEAEESYNMIMSVSEWRGSAFAEAMYGMGRCRLAAKDYKTAHSFFQRTYLMFQAYDDGKWAADSYLAAATCLVELERLEDAVNTLDAMLEDPYVNTLPQADAARNMKKKYGGVQ